MVEGRETGKWERERKLDSGRGKGNWKVVKGKETGKW